MSSHHGVHGSNKTALKLGYLCEGIVFAAAGSSYEVERIQDQIQVRTTCKMRLADKWNSLSAHLQEFQPASDSPVELLIASRHGGRSQLFHWTSTASTPPRRVHGYVVCGSGKEIYEGICETYFANTLDVVVREVCARGIPEWAAVFPFCADLNARLFDKAGAEYAANTGGAFSFVWQNAHAEGGQPICTYSFVTVDRNEVFKFACHHHWIVRIYYAQGALVIEDGVDGRRSVITTRYQYRAARSSLNLDHRGWLEVVKRLPDKGYAFLGVRVQSPRLVAADVNHYRLTNLDPVYVADGRVDDAIIEEISRKLELYWKEDA